MRMPSLPWCLVALLTPKETDPVHKVTIIPMGMALGVTISLPLAMEGTCTACAGTGARPGTKISMCGTCEGTGQYARNVGGFAMPERCPTCGGRGRLVDQPCSVCAGRGRATALLHGRSPCTPRPARLVF